MSGVPSADEGRDPWGERLPRRLGVMSAIAVVIGSTIGSGIFRTPAVVANRIDDLGMFAFAWILGGVVALCGALTFAELSAMLPRSGGVYVYIRRAFGPLPAFLFGWSQLLVLRPASFGAIAITSAEYMLRTLEIDGTQPVFGTASVAQLTAVGFIVGVGALNYRGVGWGAVVQNVSTVLKMAALLGLVVLGLLFLGSGAPPAIVVEAPAEAKVAEAWWVGFGLAMVPVLWAYDGWSDVGYISGEVRDPQRSLPRAFVLGTALVAVLYLAANAAYLMVIPLSRMPGSELVAADVAAAVLGSAGVVFVSAAVAISTFGTLNGTMMTGPRVFYAMAEDGLFFRRLAFVDPRYGTPGASIFLSVVLGSLFVSSRSFSELADLFVIGIWPFYGLAVLAVFTLRRQLPAIERPYRTWGYPWIPLVFLLATVFLLGNYLVAKPWLFLSNVVVLFSGVPVYYAWIAFTARRRTGA